MKKWTVADIPSLSGKAAIVTGAGGLGYEDALALARAGATVIIAGRDKIKGQAAVDMISSQVDGADVGYEVLDLADLASVADFGVRMNALLDKLDILINNAGVMTPPVRRTTKDGFELQFGTNYLGHFALAGHLLDLLKQANGRIISLSSIAARRGAIHFDDLQAERGYEPMPFYAQSKLACLMFALELQRRSDAAGWGVASIASHPGLSRTDLLTSNASSTSLSSLARTYMPYFFQSVAQGALPTLYAATSPDAKAGQYYGPDALFEIRGYPAPANVPGQAQDTEAAARLWDISEKLSGVTFR